MKVTIMATVFFLFSSLCSKAITVEEIVEGVEEAYRTITSLEASFIQENRVAWPSRTIRSEGRVLFKRPGMVRWEYDIPEGQTIVSDGKNLWIYRPSLNQLMVYPLEEERLLEDLLTGRLKAGRDFYVSLKGEDGEGYTLQLLPSRQKPDLKAIILKVRKEDSIVIEITLEDPFGNTTSVRFTGIRKNPSLPPDLFDLEIPEGTEVVTP